MKNARKLIRQFLLPSPTPRFVLRAGFVALLAYLFFGHLCIPMRIRGRSMEPTYHDGGFNFRSALRYARTPPARHDVVAVRLGGSSVMYLKRVVALEHETVEFRDGKLVVNGQELEEPYVRYPCDWNLAQRRVRPGYVYVVGDNRSLPMANHEFGQTPLGRIIGGPLM